MWSLRQRRLFDLILGEALSVGSQQPAAPCSAWRMQKGLLSDQTALVPPEKHRGPWKPEETWVGVRSQEGGDKDGARGSEGNPAQAATARCSSQLQDGVGRGWRSSQEQRTGGNGGGGGVLEGVAGGDARELSGHRDPRPLPSRTVTETPRGWGGGTTAPGGGLRAETMQTVAPKGLMEKPGA